MSAILVTGFLPFANYAVNSSEQVVWALRGLLPADSVRFDVLPVDHLLAHRRMAALLADVRPSVCLATGMWQGSAFRIERFGRRCPGLAEMEGDDELPGAWDWEGMKARLELTGRPVVFSEDAGKYVCDTTHWSVLEHRRKAGWPERAAFLHLPPVSEEWPVAVMAEGVVGVLADVIR